MVADRSHLGVLEDRPVVLEVTPAAVEATLVVKVHRVDHLEDTLEEAPAGPRMAGPGGRRMVAPAAMGRLGEALGEDRCVEPMAGLGAQSASTFQQEAEEVLPVAAGALPVGLEVAVARVRLITRTGSATWVLIPRSLPSWRGSAKILATSPGRWPGCRRRCIKSISTSDRPQASSLRNG